MQQKRTAGEEEPAATGGVRTEAETRQKRQKERKKEEERKWEQG